MMPSLSRPIIAACLVLVASNASAQDASPPSRDARPEIEVIDRGNGVPIVLRWRTTESSPVTVQVTTRTVPAAVETPGLDDTEPDVRLAGFMRPPVEKAWTIQGRLDRRDGADVGDLTMEARWRVVDAAARLVGIRAVATATTADEPNDAAADGPAKAPPRREDGPSTEERVSTRTDDATRGSDPDSMLKAIDVERITNNVLRRTDGAAITQVLGPEGFLPGATKVRLEAPDARADFETSGLVSIMTLAEPALPSEPLGRGGSWRTRWSAMVRATPVTIEATWTIREFDEAATTTGVADHATIRVEFTRRVADAASVSESQRAAIESAGRGEIKVRFDRPLQLEGRFVETPISVLPNRSRDVTRMRLTPIDPIR